MLEEASEIRATIAHWLGPARPWVRLAPRHACLEHHAQYKNVALRSEGFRGHLTHFLHPIDNHFGSPLWAYPDARAENKSLILNSEVPTMGGTAGRGSVASHGGQGRRSLVYRA